ncbi:MAG: ankyrin repeat domain-containing protein [Bacteroidota bacterium]
MFSAKQQHPPRLVPRSCTARRIAYLLIVACCYLRCDCGDVPAQPSHKPSTANTLALDKAVVDRIENDFLRQYIQSMTGYLQPQSATQYPRCAVNDAAALNIAGDEKEGVPIIDFLLAQGADPSQLHNGKTPLHCAISFGKQAIAMRLLAHPHIQIDTKNSDDKTPLCLAIRVGNTSLVQALLAQGANPNLPCNGMPPLHHVLHLPHSGLRRIILDLFLQLPNLDLTLQDDNGQSAIEMAKIRQALVMPGSPDHTFLSYAIAEMQQKVTN